MYLVGLLFGLGFDTATRVGLIAIAGSTAIAGGLPPAATIALPILFAAEMCLMDTLDGVFMSKAYSWAFVNPIRKIYYNITTTSLSIFVAFVIGTIELLGLLSDRLRLHGQPWRFLRSIDIHLAGRVIVDVFIIVWIGAVLNWKLRKLDERYGWGEHATDVAAGRSDRIPPAARVVRGPHCTLEAAGPGSEEIGEPEGRGVQSREYHGSITRQILDVSTSSAAR
jgi:nickel/cobalt transporter (NiCoT) family protein